MSVSGCPRFLYEGLRPGLRLEFQLPPFVVYPSPRAHVATPGLRGLHLPDRRQAAIMVTGNDLTPGAAGQVVSTHSFGTRSMSRDRRPKRDLHALNEDGMVLCNPNDKEAAHRAQMEGIATDDPTAVTCRKCLSLLHVRDRHRHER